MTRNFPPLLLSAALLVACDKARDVGDAGSDGSKPGPKVTRPARPPRQDASGSLDELRGSFKQAREIKSPDEREKAIARIAWDAYELDPGLALEALHELAVDGSERIRLIQHFAMRLAEENVDEAMKWADALDSEKETAAARCQIALVLAEADPERAANLLSESAVAGREFEVAVVQILQRWAATNPPAAAAWVAVFPPGSAREAGIKAVISPWAESDVAAVFEWMGKLEDEFVRKDSAKAMAELLMEQPENVRNDWLRSAGADVRAGIESQMKKAGLDDPPRSE